MLTKEEKVRYDHLDGLARNGSPLNADARVELYALEEKRAKRNSCGTGCGCHNTAAA